MKKTFILLSLLVLALSANVFAQKQMTAKQLFMSLPNDYIVGTAKQRAALLFTKSVKPDYLDAALYENNIPKAFVSDYKEPQGLVDLKVFRGKSSTIVGLRYQVGDGKAENPTVDSVKIMTLLLEYKDGKWTEVTDLLLPKVSVDYAYKVLTADFQMKDVKQEDVWIESQVNAAYKGIMTFARIKGENSVTALKFFKWNGSGFVEAENK
jgi:hypothetical protein